MKKRVLVAIVGIPLTIAVVFLGGIVFFLVVLLLANLALWEFFQLAEKKDISVSFFSGLLFSTLVQTLFYLLIQNELPLNKVNILLGLVLFVWLLPSMYLFVQVWNRSFATTIKVSYTIFGVLWISFVFSTLLAIRFLPLMELMLINYVGSRSFHHTFLLQHPIDDTWAA
ncbi:MAG: phosphatidate cytidylyltransferase, partial [Candidatus Kapaibacteriota bacterium]